jgi:chitinase
VARGRRRRRSGASRLLLIGVAVVAAIAAASAVVVLKSDKDQSSGTPTSTTGLSTAFAPYVYMTLAGRPTLTQIASKTGANALHLAFAIPKSTDSCSLAWDGTTALTTYASEIKEAVSDGIEVIVSSGGASGGEVAQTCGDAEDTQARLQKVLDLGVRYLDFDVEGSTRVTDADANKARAEAIVALQKKYTDLKVSFTLAAAAPTSTTVDPGADSTAPWVAAVDAGVTIDRINLMTMNYGGTIAPTDMGAVAIAAATGLHSQIETIQGVESDEAWSMVGMTPMIGVNDVKDEKFSLANAKTVAAFVTKKGVGMLSYWAVGRDQQCGAGVTTQPVATCSGVSQSAYAFASAFSTVTG